MPYTVVSLLTYLYRMCVSQSSLPRWFLFIALPQLCLIAVLWRKVFLFLYHFSFTVDCMILQGFSRKILSNFPETGTAPFCATTKASFSVTPLFTLQFFSWCSCFLMLLVVSHVALSQMIFDFLHEGNPVDVISLWKAGIRQHNTVSLW